jgi:hypothetical protein
VADVVERISSREVNVELRALVWPALQELGFTDRTHRVAWKDYPDTVGVVDFWSFGGLMAAGVGATSFSFQLEVGVRARCSSDNAAWVKVKEGKLRPKVSQCDLRRVLYKTKQQPETPFPYVWFVREDGTNLREIVEEARLVLLTEGTPWIDQFSDLDRLVTQAETGPSTIDGLGALGSPARARLIADIRQALPR